MLTAMPSAKGLFHKAVVLSGASVRAGDKAMAEKLGQLRARRGRPARPAEIDKLQQMPWKQYYEIATKAQRKLAAELAAAGTRTGGLRAGFSPSVDGTILPQHPLRARAGADRGERADDHLLGRERAGAGVDRRVADEHHAARGRREAEAAGRLRPRLRRQGDGGGHRLRQGVTRTRSRSRSGRSSAATARASSRWPTSKSKQPAPVFVTWFAWQPPLFDGRIGAFHCVDICFWFNNTDVMLHAHRRRRRGRASWPRRCRRRWCSS